jgi:hypothetical protein
VQPALNPPLFGNGQFKLSISGDSGPDYNIFASTNLTDWTLLLSTNSPPTPFEFLDPATNFSQRFYRVLLSP